MTNVVTYDTLFELLRTEKSEPVLQRLPETFLGDVSNYFLKKQEILLKSQKNSTLFSSDQSDAILHEIRNAKKIIAEIFNRREKKIVTLAQNVVKAQMQHHDLSQLLPLEHDLFVQFMDKLSEHRNKILNAMTQEDSRVVATPSQVTSTANASAALSASVAASISIVSTDSMADMAKYLITSDVPEFIGPDLERYGPFKQNEVASIPQMVATILLERGQIQAMNESVLVQN